MKSAMEQIYDYVKANPGVTATQVRDALCLHASSASSLVSQLEVRGALSSMRAPAVQGERAIKSYRAAIPEFRLLPAPKRAKPAPVVVQPLPAAEEPARSGNTTDEYMRRIETPPPAVLPVLLRDATQAQLLEQLIRVQRAEVKREIELAIMERISAAFAEPGATPELEPERPAARLAPVHGLRRYLIVGLLPAQALITTAKLSAACELRYWKDESTDRLRQHARWADVVVVMTKFISHSTQAVAKSTSTTLLSCNGGVSDLVAQITHDIDANSLH